MSDWIDIASVTEFPPGTSRVVYVDDVDIAVINIDGQYHALENVCTHDGSILLSDEFNPEAFIEGEEVTCPRHGARFCIRTGEALSPPAYEPVTTFPTRVENDMVQVRLVFSS